MKKELTDYKKLFKRDGIHVAHRLLNVSVYDEDFEEDLEYELLLDFFIWGDGSVYCFSDIEDSKDYFYWFSTENIEMKNIDAEIDELINNFDDECIQLILDHRDLDWMDENDPNLVYRGVLKLY